MAVSVVAGVSFPFHQLMSDDTSNADASHRYGRLVDDNRENIGYNF